MLSESSRAEMLEINREQQSYYEKADGVTTNETNGLATNLWRWTRGAFFDALSTVDVEHTLEQLHTEWMGDVSSLRVLEIGVGSGNPLSVHLAREAREYLAIDLSQRCVDDHKTLLSDAGVVDARVEVMDFLDPSFDKGPFDLVNAISVVHHFRHLGAFLEILRTNLAENGTVITYDPLTTWLPARLVRGLYRPFQDDADWEFPFDNDSLRSIEEHFSVDEIYGLYGRSKWGAFLSLSRLNWASNIAGRWHDHDLQAARSITTVGHCLQATMKLSRKAGPTTTGSQLPTLQSVKDNTQLVDKVRSTRSRSDG